MAAGMGGIRTAGDLVAWMQMTRKMKIDAAKQYVADKLAIDVIDLTNEELMRQIMALIDEVREHRGKVEKETGRILGRFAVARAAYPPEYLDEAVMLPTKKVAVEVTAFSPRTAPQLLLS